MPTDAVPGMFPRFAPPIQEDLKALKANWFWFLLLGLGLILVGAYAVAHSVLFTVVNVKVFGLLMIVGGLLCIGGSLFTGCWGGFFLTLLSGVLDLVVGVIAVRHPIETAVVFTAVMAMFFLAGGLFRVLAALSGRFRAWPMVLLNGVISFGLGLMIWNELPYSGLWLIGTFFGIDLIFNGSTYVALALSAKSLPSEPAAA